MNNNIKLKLITNNKVKLLKNMLQLYLHDISFYFPIEFDEKKGLYLYDDLNKYFNNKNACGYFIKYNKNIAGFALVEENDKKMIIQEMFILNNYKNKGIGKEAAFQIFNAYTGEWVVKSLPNSVAAEQFWQKTINNYTNGNFNLDHVGRYNRAVFIFNSRDINAK